MDAVGLDQDPELLKIAENKKSGKGASAEFISADMIRAGDLFESEAFDLITCMGNTLVHLDSPGEVSGFFKTVYALLKKGGVFTGQLVNYENPDSGKPGSFNIIDTGEFRFRRENRAFSGGERIKFTGEMILKPSGKRFSNQIDLIPLKKAFVEKELKRTGFHDLRFYGDFDRAGYSGDSDALIFTGVK